MIVALIILGALFIVGFPLYLMNRRDEIKAAAENHAEPQAPTSAATAAGPAVAATETASDVDSEVCCGMHISCEKDSLLADVSDKIDYFDDEELDRYAGRGADSYNDDEIEEFRDVLLTLLPTDIAPWARSIQLRGITLPIAVREELLMIVAEARMEQNA
jgi:hypothetical protein